MKNPLKNEKHNQINQINGCETVELLDKLYIGDEEKLLFEARVEEIKNKKDKLLDEIGE